MHPISDPNSLSTEQLALIAAAAKDGGRISIAVRSDTKGRAARTKTETFFDSEDSTVAARYIEHLLELKRLMVFREVDRNGKYELTNVGWLLSRKS